MGRLALQTHGRFGQRQALLPLGTQRGPVRLVDPQPFAGDPTHGVAHRVKHVVNEVAHALGGTFSAEHGIGQVLTQEMALFKPAVELDLMRGIKDLLDPQHLFNPGRLLPAPSSSPSPSR